MIESKSNSKTQWVWLGVTALFVLHQDFWWWNDPTLLLGFLPVGLFYHSLFSIAAGLIWALAGKFAWPEEIETWAAETDDNTPQTEGKP